MVPVAEQCVTGEKSNKQSRTLAELESAQQELIKQHLKETYANEAIKKLEDKLKSLMLDKSDKRKEQESATFTRT